MNIEYVKKLSVVEDVAIIFATVFSVLKQDSGVKNDGEDLNS